jgi:hypothetical protein
MQFVPNKLVLGYAWALILTGLVGLFFIPVAQAGNRQTNATSAMIEILVPNGTGIKVADAAPININPNDTTNSKLVWNGKLPKDTKIPANSLVKITTNVATAATTALKYQAACRWIEMEAGWKGEWRRRFQDPNTFDAIWTTAGQKPITAELTITRNGNQVSIRKKDASNGSNCEYSGVIRNGGRTVKGTYTCKQGNVGREMEWTAMIGANCQ